MNSRSRHADRFRDRQEAGIRLGERLREAKLEGDILVLGLPRGGVPVAAEVASALGADLDILIVRKLGAPFNPELAIGAIASGDVIVLNDRLVAQMNIDEETIDAIRAREHEELLRRERKYRGDRAPPVVKDRIVVLVDDGVATGATMQAAVLAIRKMKPARIVVAVPTCSVDAEAMLKRCSDEVIALSTPEPYFAVGAWYEIFNQLEDEDVTAILDETKGAR